MNHNISHWLTLTQLPKLRISRIKALLSQCGSITHLFNTAHLSQHFTSAEIFALNNPNAAQIEAALTWEMDEKHHILTWDHPQYPPLLKEIANAPPILFAKGDVTLLSQPQIGMVGSRNPTHTGTEIAEEFAAALTQAGLIVTSGLALGIDTASHQGALQAKGNTIAVLGSGLAHIYPKKNSVLAEKIADNGCLISEWPLNTPPKSEHFPRRNRIISGLSLGTLVVEAALKSGSLITARYALEQNREVFAIPGSIRNTASVGTLSLIQQGAKCVTCINDILEELNLSPQLNYQERPTCTKRSLDPTSLQVLACIENEATSVDQICARSRLSPHLVISILLSLELEGSVKRHHGAYVRT